MLTKVRLDKDIKILNGSIEACETDINGGDITGDYLKYLKEDLKFCKR